MIEVNPDSSGPEGLAHALAYARHGWRVLPLHHPIFFNTGPGCSCANVNCESIGKHPRIARGCHGASTDSDQIRKWWERWPSANVGIATGPESGMFGLDLDPEHGGHESLQRLEAEHGPLPFTRRFLTGGGGEHVLFSYPDGEHLTVSVGKLGAGLDTRGAGGLIVAPPSLHASRQRYRSFADEWADEPLPLPLPLPPPWLIERLRAPKTEAGKSVKCVSRFDVMAGADEGSRNHTVASLSGHLLRRYVEPHTVLELVRCWNAVRCRPPLADAEIVRTVNSICRRELARREAAQ